MGLIVQLMNGLGQVSKLAKCDNLENENTVVFLHLVTW